MIFEEQEMVNMLDVKKKEAADSLLKLENYILNEFDVKCVDTMPETESALYTCYAENTEYVYRYLRSTVGPWLFPLSNEIRALLGHIADYRLSDSNGDKRNLEKAYGHFRRLTLDAFKVLCDEFDYSLVQQLQKEYTHDYRDVCVDYLKDFSTKYIAAKSLYIEAQSQEKLGSDLGKHNIIEKYYKAATAYILLRQFYRDHKKDIQAARRKAIIRNALRGAGVIFGLVVTLLEFILT